MKQQRLAPQLRRPLEGKGTAKTFATVAQFAIVPPQDVIGTNQPMFVRRIELDRIAQRKNPGAANQRNIVVVDDIEAFRENGRDCLALYDWPSGLLRQQS